MASKVTKFIKKVEPTKTNLTIAFIVSYIFLLLGGTLFVKNALKQDTDQITKKTKEIAGIEEKPIRVNLSIDYGDARKKEKVFYERLKNTQAVLDYLDDLRLDDQLSYEKVAYTYGTEIDDIDGVSADENHKWKVYFKADENNVQDQIKNVDPSDREIEILNKSINEFTDITFDINSLKLVNESEIRFVYEKIE